MKLDAPTKCASLRAFGSMFVAHPRLMLGLEQLGLVDAVMSREADVSLQLVALQCWQKILEVSPSGLS